MAEASLDMRALLIAQRDGLTEQAQQNEQLLQQCLVAADRIEGAQQMVRHLLQQLDEAAKPAPDAPPADAPADKTDDVPATLPFPGKDDAAKTDPPTAA